MRVSNCFLTIVCSILLACGGQETPAIDDALGAPATRWRVVAEPTVEPIEVSCGIDERAECDAVDNDCDGQVDEACQLGPSERLRPEADAIHVAATWNSGADVDLVLTQRDGSPLDESQVLGSASRGEGDCGSPPNRSLSRLERLSLSPHNLQGFQVRVHTARSCGMDENTMATVSISLPQAGVTTFNVRLQGEGTPVPVADLVPGNLRHSEAE